MYAREITTHLKSSTLNDFNRTFEAEILPMLRKQKGFKDTITFFAPTTNDVITISFWRGTPRR